VPKVPEDLIYAQLTASGSFAELDASVQRLLDAVRHPALRLATHTALTLMQATERLRAEAYTYDGDLVRPVTLRKTAVVFGEECDIIDDEGPGDTRLNHAPTRET
jgi:hypothetical protein